jgi:hypothetical protein
MRHRGVVAFAAALVVVASAGARGSENKVTYRDVVGEEPAAPDITTVRVSNDVVGVITFRANVPNRPALTKDMRIYLNVDADLDASTGAGVAGRDYWLLVDPISYGDNDAHPLFCADTVCGVYPADRPTPSGVFSHTYSSGPTIKVDSSYLGDTKRFRFQIVVVDGIAVVPGVGFDFTNSHRDLAPDAGWWRYDVKIGPDRLLATGFSTVPRAPQAGRAFAVKLAATRDDTGARVVSGRVACVARAGARPVQPSSESFVGGQAVCVFRIPGGTAGTWLRGAVTIVAEGRTLTRPFSAKIR